MGGDWGEQTKCLGQEFGGRRARFTSYSNAKGLGDDSLQSIRLLRLWGWFGCVIREELLIVHVEGFPWIVGLASHAL
jgi:hypothetical protein